ncbi:MAG TPA: MFS transporter [Micromonosporaceae bacterium]
MVLDQAGVEASPRAGRREWLGLAVLALPALLVSVDVFVLLLALPQLSVALGADSTQQLWIMDSYGFLLSGFMITMGTLGDRIGRRRLLLVGAAGFGVASVLAAYAPSAEMLIVARGVLGVAGATLAPSTLALISNMFRDPRQRALAISVWLVAFVGGAAMGPLVGGVLLANFWWGSVFLLGVPAMVLLLAVGRFLLPEYRAPRAGRLDLVSVALSLAAILPLVYALKEFARAGAGPVAVLAGTVGAGFGVLFVRRQRRLTDPLLDLRLFRDRAFTVALVSMLFGTMLMGAIMLLITQHLQLVEGLSPLRAGLWMLPAAAASVVSFVVSPLLARRLAPARLIAAGLVVAVAGLVLLTQVDARTGLSTVVTGFALINLGAGPLVTLGTDLVVGSAPPERAGAAASMNETSGEFGFAFGIAALGSLGGLIYRQQLTTTLPTGLPAHHAEAALESMSGAVDVAGALPERLGSALLEAAGAAFTNGLHVAAGVSAVALLLVTGLVAAALRHVPPIGR